MRLLDGRFNRMKIFIIITDSIEAPSLNIDNQIETFSFSTLLLYVLLRYFLSHWYISSARLDQQNHVVNIKRRFQGKKLYILIALEILYHPVYLSLDSRLFAEKYFEYNEDTLTPIDNVRNIFQQINASQDLNTQGDRESRALSECIITFLKIYVLHWRYNSTDPHVHNLCTDRINI